MPARFFGTPDGVKVGDLFIDRKELHDRHVHAPIQAGISGTKSEGADSIVVSGGYRDDEDHGDYIIYTGHGGNDPNTHRQIADQSPSAPGNAGLITSMVEGLPVRVVRGKHPGSAYAPPVGYQYAGLFLVTDAWMKPGLDQFQVIQFKLERIPEQSELVTRVAPEIDPAYAVTTVSRRIRDTALSREIKNMYAHACQICGTVIPGTGERLYSEGAHVKPLGRPHLGADALTNLLCLCPNHHTELDIGGMVILDDFSVALTADMKPFSELHFRGSHRLLESNAKYQREMWATI
ncbi:MAG TPA: YDG/SRA domain-containing protein [Galbitalea sp.]|jgi:putative restriction endonuclease|nr:YDG/SRA domain-containing protein [Galbitalea sp.]